MRLKKSFLQLPLNAQIYISIMVIIMITLLLIIFLSQAITLAHFDYLLSIKKLYFYSMHQNIMESNIYFLNLCILQYENLIKLFNYQFYLFLKDEVILKEFTFHKNVDNNTIFIFKNPGQEIIPDFSVSNEEQILYIYNYAKNKIVNDTIIFLIASNYLSYVNQVKAVRNLKIPYYGEVYFMGEYIISLSNYNILFSLNNTRIKEVYEAYDGNLDLYLNFVYSIQDINYNYFKKFFELFKKNELFFIDIMYILKTSIFSNYKEIEDESIKKEYIKNQSIFFQSIFFENDSTWFCEKWDSKNSRFQGANNIRDGYMDILLYQLSSKIGINSIPFNHQTNKIISKNLCYFFLYKQIIYLNITSDINFEEFNENFLNDIYNEIYNKETINIDDCKLEKYYHKDFGPLININKDFYDYYNLEYLDNTFIYLLRNKDANSLIFETKHCYPNYMILKDFFPNFFSFQQLDFYSFSFGDKITKNVISSNQFLLNIRYLMLLCLIVNWAILFFIILIITHKTILQVTEPIIRLTEIINLNNLNEKNINENIFEYKSDDEINQFFLLCKKLINGEIKDSNLKNKENVEMHKNMNNNMIINNKMILELIENQKTLNTNDKEIYLLKQNYSIDTRHKRLKTHKSSRRNNQDSQGLHFNLIKLESSKSNENQLLNSSEEFETEVEENDPELNNMKYYENLLYLTDYIYNGNKEKNNNSHEKLRMNATTHASINNNSIIKFGSVSNISINKNDYENKNYRRDCKFITYYWYAHSKKNKLFGND